MHEGAIRAYMARASSRGLTADQLDELTDPWLGPEGQGAFYRQIAQADEAYTREVEGLYPSLRVPCLVVWGECDSWIPLERGRRLAAAIPGAQLVVVPDAGHLIQLDQPVRLATTLSGWLSSQVAATPAAS